MTKLSIRPEVGVALPTFLYRLFDADGVLLYVGITDNLRSRMVHHSLKQPWWDQVADVTIEMLATRELAEAAEWTAILAERPSKNVSKIRPRYVAKLRGKPAGNTPVHQFRIDPGVWDRFGALAEPNRSEVLREFVRWYTHKQGAALPPRP